MLYCILLHYHICVTLYCIIPKIVYRIVYYAMVWCGIRFVLRSLVRYIKTNSSVLLTCKTTVELHSHGDVAMPALGLKADITSHHRRVKFMDNNAIAVNISPKYLHRRIV